MDRNIMKKLICVFWAILGVFLLCIGCLADELEEKEQEPIGLHYATNYSELPRELLKEINTHTEELLMQREKNDPGINIVGISHIADFFLSTTCDEEPYNKLFNIYSVDMIYTCEENGVQYQEQFTSVYYRRYIDVLVDSINGTYVVDLEGSTDPTNTEFQIHNADGSSYTTVDLLGVNTLDEVIDFMMSDESNRNDYKNELIKTEEAPGVTNDSEFSYHASSGSQEDQMLPDLPSSFVFASGVGAWNDSLELNRDGSFTGCYYDSEFDESYPNGLEYLCNYSGKFENITKINDYSYSMNLTDLKLEKNAGEEWDEDGIHYISTRPYGIDGQEFTLYLPGTKKDDYPEAFDQWYYGVHGKQIGDTLKCFALVNNSQGYVFWGMN